MNATGNAAANRYQSLGMAGPLNPVLEVLSAHASCRSFREEPLPEGTLERIVVAAQSASTSSNMQAYSIVAVADGPRKQRLMELCGNQAMIGQCPLFLVFCPDIHRLRWLSRRQGYDFGADYLEMFLVAVVDAALAAQNAAAAAESMGLGICYVGAVRNHPEQVIDLLELPEGVFALTGMCVGHPAAGQRPVKARLPLEGILHRERYSDHALEEAVAAYDQVMAASGIYAGRRVDPGQLAAEGGEDAGPDHYGWAEHTARRLTGMTGNRARLRQILESHGWNLR